MPMMPTKPPPLVRAAALCLLGAALFRPSATAGPRRVSCAHAREAINASDAGDYQVLFRGLEDSSSLQAKDTLQFETLAGLASAAWKGADMLEAMVIARRVEDRVSVPNTTVAGAVDAWQQEWQAAGDAAEAAAVAFRASGASHAAAAAYGRAATYLLLSERFSDHMSPPALRVYNRSVAAFQSSLALGSSPCASVSIPYTGPNASSGASLHGYWCTSGTGSSPTPTVVMMTGYDGTAEMLVGQFAGRSAAQGMSLLAFEGPGQGSVARFQGLRFRPDWEEVVAQVVSWAAASLPAFDQSRMALWGRSFGGYLAPRAFSASAGFKALVADGGMADLYQTFVCGLPQHLQELWYSAPQQFETYMEIGASTSLQLSFLRGFGSLGFGSRGFADLYAAVEPYFLDASAFRGIAARPVLVNNPSLDAIAGNQSSLFFGQLQRPLHRDSVLLGFPAARGAALHCSVGSTSVASEAELAWTARVLAAA